MIGVWRNFLNRLKTAETPRQRFKRRRLQREAQEHYRRGNRLIDVQNLDGALGEFRQASWMWRSAQALGRGAMRRFLHLRAALLFLVTVLLLYTALYSLFPRDPFDLLMLSAGQNNAQSWWERLMDTGRPQAGDNHKMGVREWWERFKRRMQGGPERETTVSRGTRPPIDERWESLLRRYGRWGPYFNSRLDYALVSGYGLSQNGAYDEAVTVLRKGIEATQEPARLADLYQGLANTHYYNGYQLQPNGLANYDLEAVRKSTQAYEMSVGHQPRAVSYGNLGWMYFLLGEYDKASQFSRQALEMDGGLEYVRLNLGLIYLKQDRIFDSFRVYRSVIERNPPDEVYMGGINDLREVLRDAPGRHPFAYLMLGLLAVQKGEFETARDALERFMSAPYTGQAWRDLAQRMLRTMPAEGVP